MKRTLSLILALTLALSCMFTLIACSGCKEHVDADYDEICDVCEEAVPHTPEYLGFEGIYNTDYEEDEKTVYGTASLETALNDMTYSSTASNLLVFTKSNAKSGEKKLAILNAETGAVVYTLTKEEDDAKIITTASVTNYGNESFIRVTTTNRTDKNNVTYTYKLLTSLGKEITSKTTKSQTSISVTPKLNDLYEIDEKLYKIEDGVATLKQEIGLAGIPSYNVKTEKYNYVFDDAKLFVYDKDNKNVALWEAPVNADDGDFFVLSNGNVLIQYVVMLPWDAAEYDVYENAMYKYNLTSLIFDVETKTAKELELDYYVEYVDNALTNEDFYDTFAKDKLHNVVTYVKIVDKMFNENDVVYADMTDNMLTIGYLAEEVAGQYDFAELIADNRFIVETESGMKYILNEKGVVLGEVTGADFNEIPGYILKGNKLYDFDLNVVFDAESIEYTGFNGREDYSLFYDTNYDADDKATTTYYIFNNASMKQLVVPKGVATSDFNCYDNYFYYEYEETVDSTTKYYRTYCNVKGDVIKTVELYGNTSYSLVAAGDAFVLRATTIESSTTTIRYYIAK